MFEAATKDAISFAPGGRWQYSDVGYFLLGMIIEKASGQRYRNFLALVSLNRSEWHQLQFLTSGPF